MKEIEDFLAYIADVRGLSENTVKSYRVDLEEWALFLSKTGLDVSSFTRSDAAAYTRVCRCRSFARTRSFTSATRVSVLYSARLTLFASIAAPPLTS